MLQHSQERPKHRHCTHKKWNKLKTFYFLLRIHNSALQYNVTWLAGALFELTAFYLKNWSVPCAKKACPRLKIWLVTHKLINIITWATNHPLIYRRIAYSAPKRTSKACNGKSRLMMMNVGGKGKIKHFNYSVINYWFLLSQCRLKI